MFEVIMCADLGKAKPIGTFDSKAEAEQAVYRMIEATFPDQTPYIYGQDDDDNPGCADFFVGAGMTSVIFAINKKGWGQ